MTPTRDTITITQLLNIKTTANLKGAETVAQQLLDLEMVSFYQSLTSKPRDTKQAKERQLARLALITEDSLDANVLRLEHFSAIVDLEKTVEASKLLLVPSVAVAVRIDALFLLLKVALVWSNVDLVKSTLKQLQDLIDKGGDWDKRNRLSVYKAFYLIQSRNFNLAAPLLSASLPSFACKELMSFAQFVQYTLIVCSLAFSRTDFKLIINSPEIHEVHAEISQLSLFANSLYNCDYSQFFKSLAIVEQIIKNDVYLKEHYLFYVREMRIKAYAQLLESYRSVTLESMANCFGVSVAFIDRYFHFNLVI